MLVMAVCHYYLHVVLERSNEDSPQLIAITKAYKKILLPDILIKIGGLILSLTVYPPMMMYGVITAAVFMLSAKYLQSKHLHA